MTHTSVLVIIPASSTQTLEDVMHPFEILGANMDNEEAKLDSRSCKIVDDDGEIYYDNPNGKWAEYEVGGRYRGYFITKVVVLRNLQLTSNGSDEVAIDQLPSKVVVESSFAPFDLIDWDSMLQRSYEDCLKSYDMWCEMIERHGDSDEAVQSIRDMSGIQEGDTCESYAQRTAKVHPTYAVLKGGVWHENWHHGEYKPEEQWQSEFYQLVMTCRPDDILVVVDCHR